METKYPDEAAYLREVLAIIRAQLASLGEGIVKKQSEWNREAKYLWREMSSLVMDESHAMDWAAQTGLIHGAEHEISEKAERRRALTKMLDKTYFGRVDFKPDGEDKESFYIGLANLMDESYSMRVCDWRAPVSSLYYEQGAGRTSYAVGEEQIKGEVSLLRQYEISGGKLQYVVDSELKIDDKVLIEALSGSAGEKMKTIVQTIQREQNDVIRDSAHELLLILGPAGSGKTSIALHRVAYLLYRDRPALTSRNILIFSPNDIFSDYISDVIPELGERAVRTTTFADLIKSYVGENVRGMYEQVDLINTPPAGEKERSQLELISYKSGKEFAALIKRFVAEYKPDFEDIAFAGQEVFTKAELDELYLSSFSHMKPADRFAVIAERIRERLKPIEKDYRKRVRAELVVPGEDEFQLQTRLKRSFREAASAALENLRRIAEPNLRTLYSDALRFIAEHSAEAGAGLKARLTEQARTLCDVGKLDFEDGVGILLIAALFGMIPRDSQIKHVVIDEIQDYSPAQHEVFARLFDTCKLTMLGDAGQLLNKSVGMTSGEEIAAIYGRERSAVRRLTKSYRSTAEINRFALSALGTEDTVDYVERHGKPVELITENSFSAITAQIAAVLDACGGKPGATAVITKTKDEARRYYQALKRLRPELVLTDDENEGGFAAESVIPLPLAKGLEFDRVIIADSAAYSREQDRMLLYVAATRAMHELTVCSIGAPSPLIGGQRA